MTSNRSNPQPPNPPTPQPPGTVFLVGAGPGDPKLATLRAVECIQAAQVIVYDRLVAPELLRHARPEARLVYVGKAASRHTMPQEEINELLAQEAGAGRVVCRLKGGDPFVFGRGGEEALYLVERGIPFEVVPGVTSAVAVPAYAGIPVTDRCCASVLAVVTGQEDADKSEDTIRWDELARSADTLVILMGVGNLKEIASRLLAAGRSPETPVALVRRGTTPSQQTLVSTLVRVSEEAAGISPPVVIVVGEVVRLREKLRWFDQRPLFGITVLVTRSRDQASELTERLERLGAGVVELPSIRIEPLELDPAALRETFAQSWDWLVFTSANAVRVLADQLRQAGLDLRALGSARLAAIGSGTGAALAERGLRVDFIPGEYIAEQVVQEFPEPVEGKRVLIPRAEKARELLPEELARRSAQVKVLPIYRTVPDQPAAERALEAIGEGRVDLVTFTSSSTVENFVKLVGRVPDGLAAACIGPVTAQAARSRGLRVEVQAAEHTIAGLVEAVVGWAAGRKDEG